MEQKGLKEVSKCQDLWGLGFFFFSFSFVVSRILGGFVVIFSFQNLVNTNPFLMADFGFNVMQWAIPNEIQSRNNVSSYAAVTKSSFQHAETQHMIKWK